MHHMLRYHVERISFPLEPKGLTRITSVTYVLHKGDCVHATREGHNCILCLYTPSFVREGLSSLTYDRTFKWLMSCAP